MTYPVLRRYENCAAAYSAAIASHVYNEFVPTTPAEARYVELNNELFDHYRELTRIFSTLAALGEQVIEEALARGEESPINIEPDDDDPESQ